MSFRKLFAKEQELERVFILYGNTTDCYYNGNGQPFLSFEPLLESHLTSLGYERVIFYSGTETLKCYDEAHSKQLEQLLHPQKDERDAVQERPVTAGVTIKNPRFAAKQRTAVVNKTSTLDFTFSAKEESIHRYLDQAMRDKQVKTCVVFTHCWSMLDMQTNGDLKERMADVINSWYSLSANNHNIAVFLFGEPRLESLAGFLRNKSAWAFLYERMFNNDLPTDAVIRIGGPQRDEIYQQVTRYIRKKYYTSEVEKAATTLVQKHGNKLLALKRFLEHNVTDSELQGKQQQEVLNQLLKEYGDSESVDAVKKIQQTEGWQEISRLVSRLIDEAKAMPRKEEDITELLQELGGSNLRLTLRETEAAAGVNMTIMLKGNPGTGKTTAAHWIGEAFRQNGLLPVGRVITATKDQLEAGYVGQSAIKTREKINEAIGNVLFIDEAYSLFRSEDEGRASFGREVIDTLLEAMSARRGELAIILAGYPKEMDHFLTANPGLRRRFGDNIVTIQDYDAGMLERIALDDLASDSGEGVSVDPDERNKSSMEQRYHYLLDEELIYSNQERSDGPCEPLTPEDAKQKTREDREQERELSPFSIYFDNWFADRDRVSFGNAGAALQLADTLRQKARRRTESSRQATSEAIVIRKEDFPEGTEHLFVCRKPSVTEVERQLKDVVGMKQVKETLMRIAAYMQISVLQQSLHPEDRDRRVEPGHYLFIGPPGTGKTMISEKLALVLSGLGITQRYQPIRVTGLELANMITGHRGVDKLKEFIDSCSGGVLVIDEAHQLGQTNLGPIAVKTLLDPMIQKKYEMSFVFCCYPDEEKVLFELEPGLARRISDIIRFENYNAEEIVDIFKLKASREQYQMDEEVGKAILEAVMTLIASDNQNGGTAEKLFKSMKMALSQRLISEYKDKKHLETALEADPALLTRFVLADVENALLYMQGECAAPGYHE